MGNEVDIKQLSPNQSLKGDGYFRAKVYSVILSRCQEAHWGGALGLEAGLAI